MPPLPTSRSRAASRAGSRAPSPTMSIRSRKSVMSTTRSKRRNSYLDPELTDDEDSEDDRRSMVSQRSGFVGPRRTRRISSASQSYEEDFLDSRPIKNKMPKERRPSQSDWPQRRSSATQITTKAKVPASDSPMTPESESEPQTAKAMVQAKIQEKINANVEKEPPPVPAPPTFEDDGKEDEETNEEVQVQEEPKEEGDGDSLGPPPSTPDHEWECEFCTFVNEPNVKICVVCCKTPVKKPTKKEPVTILKQPSQSKDTLNGSTMKTKDLEEISSKLSSVEVEPKSENKKGRRNKRISFWLGTKVN